MAARFLAEREEAPPPGRIDFLTAAVKDGNWLPDADQMDQLTAWVELPSPTLGKLFGSEGERFTRLVGLLQALEEARLGLLEGRNSLLPEGRLLALKPALLQM